MRRMRISVRALIGVLAIGALAACDEPVAGPSPELERGAFALLGGLDVGEAVTLEGKAARAFFLAAYRIPAEYVVVPFNASMSPQRLWFQVGVHGAESPAAAGASGFSATAASLDGDMPHLSSADDLKNLLYRQMIGLAPQLAAVRHAKALRGFTHRVDIPQHGDLLEINVNVRGDPCLDTDYRSGRVEAVGRHAIMVADVGNPAGGFSQADYQQFATEFDDLIHPVLTRYFDEPTDIDGNGRVVIFFTRAVNEVGAGGFVHARDILPRAVCPASNEAEILFQVVPDPGAETPLSLSLQDALRLTPGIMGHEYQHLINAGRRVWINDADGFEEAWLNEALSHVAEEMLFYAASGVAPRSNVSSAMLEAAGSEAKAAFSKYGAENLNRYYGFLRNVSAGSPLQAPTTANRGAAWAFLRFMVDHSHRPDDAVLRGLVNGRRTGLSNLRDQLGLEPLDALHDWTVSMILDDRPGPAMFERWQQPSWNFREIYEALAGGFPLGAEHVQTGSTNRFHLSGGGSLVMELQSIAGTAGRITASGLQSDSSPPDQLRVQVVRVK